MKHQCLLKMGTVRKKMANPNQSFFFKITVSRFSIHLFCCHSCNLFDSFFSVTVSQVKILCVFPSKKANSVFSLSLFHLIERSSLPP